MKVLWNAGGELGRGDEGMCCRWRTRWRTMWRTSEMRADGLRGSKQAKMRWNELVKVFLLDIGPCGEEKMSSGALC